jgi:protein tyrosine phosphatase (PTP) superfamily phosphohydrolase (DUF442 family)
MAVSDAVNFRQVNDRLATAGKINAPQLGELKAEGYEAVISLLPADNKDAIANEPDIVLSQGLDYTYIPVEWTAPTAADYEEFARAMQANGDRKLMVHCAANYRVTAFYAIYAVRYLGWTREQAFDFIGETWSLSEYPVWRDFVDEMLEQS